jgi:IS30 family transposase
MPGAALDDVEMKSRKPKEWTEGERKRLAAMARRRVPASEIATSLGRHTGSVRRIAREMGLLLKK